MLVRTTRTLSTFTLRALFFGALFIFVVVVHMGLTGALREMGWGGGVSLLASGAVVLGLVLALVNLADWVRERRDAAREIQRMRLGLPGGPCCVVWRSAEGEQREDAMPWRLSAPMHARYPSLARRLGVEGVAVAEFEVSSEGRAKNVHCVYVWPSDVFYRAALEALNGAQFEAKPDAQVRFGASYRMPFVFRIAGAARLKESGVRARTLWAPLRAARRAALRLRASR
jgi:TonB family protein